MFQHINKSSKRDWPLISSHLTSEWVDATTLATRTGLSPNNVRNLLLTYIHFGLIESRQIPNPKNPVYSKTLVRKKS
jgi:hypothetical protein